MDKRGILILFAITALVCSTETEDSEKNKRGASKINTLNSIPTGAQKQDYTYNLYQQNSQSNPTYSLSNPTYASQVSSSFYPSQGSQYYSPGPVDPASGYPTQPHINLIPPPAQQSQFVPLNFIVNPNYQKYPSVQPKPQGSIQLAFIQPSSYPATQQVQGYPQTFFSPNSAAQYSPHQSQVLTSISPQGQFISPNVPFSFGGGFLNQPSSMLFVAQPNPSIYSNLGYPSVPTQNYNHIYANVPPKYSLSYANQPASTPEYDKLQGPLNAPKEDNDISNSNSNEYLSPSESSTNYKSYTSGRGSSYTKLT